MITKEEEQLIRSVHMPKEDIEWTELFFLKLFKPKSFKLFIERLQKGYSYYYAIKNLRLKWKN